MKVDQFKEGMKARVYLKGANTGAFISGVLAKDVGGGWWLCNNEGCGKMADVARRKYGLWYDHNMPYAWCVFTSETRISSLVDRIDPVPEGAAR